ncbi:PAS domain-containing protein, partial [Streptomyces clavuligerus]|uniref:PAS domain-containing protein n=1 Tax=Streptomyces clavuligerus TaxID=1901 RepID=UPI0018D130D6
MSSRPSRGAARLAAILDALPDGLVLVNCNGTVVNANTIALELFEAPGTALVGRGLLDLLPTFDSRLIPGSMRRPEATDERGRTKPTRMVARRTDGNEFPVEVTSAGLEDGRDAYASRQGYTGDELLMLVVRDLSGTLDTEAELARSQRQTEMILRAAAEGVVGTDTEGRVVLVNPAAAQILGFRASDLGGQELHPLILHSREDGKPFPYAESPLADTLRSGRKHRVRGQVLWAKDGSRVPVDLTTAPVRDGDQLVGAVMTFTDRRPAEALAERHAAELAGTTERLTAELTATTERFTTELAENEERFTAELADKSERYTTEIERRDERYEELAARHGQLTAVLDGSLRGPLLELRRELGTLADDPAGQLWPEANQILHHLAAGYARMTTLIDNVLGFQRLDTGGERLDKTKVMLDAVVAAGVEGAIELIGPGRVQFAVHAPAIEAEVDTVRLATALAHLAADVAGVDSTGKTRLLPDGGYADSTVVIAAAQRGDVVRIEVRGPFSGGDPVHEPIVRGIVTAHGGVLQTHEMPGMSGSAYVLEVPLGDGAGGIAQEPPAVGGAGSGAPDGTGAPGPSNALPAAPETMPELLPESLAETGEPVEPAGSADDAGLPALPRGAGTAPLDAADRPGDPMDPMEAVEAAGSGRRRGRRSSTDAFLESPVSAEGSASGEDASQPTGRRRAAAPAAPATGPAEPPHAPLPGQGSVPPRTAVPGDGTAAADDTPHDGGEPDGPAAAAATAPGGTGRRRGRPSPAEGDAVPAPESARPGAEGQPVPAGVDDRPGPAVPQGAEGTADNADNANDTDDTATAAEGAAPRSAPGQPVPPQAPEPGRPVPPGGVPPQTARSVAVPPRGTPPQQGGGVSLPQQSTGAPQDRAPRPVPPQGMPPQPVPPHGAVPQHGPVPPQGLPHGLPQGLSPHGAVPELSAAVPGGLGGPGGPAGPQGGAADARPAGRRARRALAPSPVSPDQPDHSDHSDQAGAPAAGPDGPRPAFALPPAEADRVGRVPGGAGSDPHDRHDPVRVAPGADHTPPEHHPLPTGRRRARPAGPQDDTDGTGSVAVPAAAPDGNAPARPAAPGATGTDTGSVSLPLPDLEAPHPGAARWAARRPRPRRNPPPTPGPPGRRPSSCAAAGA